MPALERCLPCKCVHLREVSAVEMIASERCPTQKSVNLRDVSTLGRCLLLRAIQLNEVSAFNFQVGQVSILWFMFQVYCINFNTKDRRKKTELLERCLPWTDVCLRKVSAKGVLFRNVSFTEYLPQREITCLFEDRFPPERGVHL